MVLKLEKEKVNKNSTPLRCAISGLGFISTHGHMPTFVKRMKGEACATDIEVIAVCDIEESRIKNFLQLDPVFKDVRVYTDYFEMIKNEKDNIDFVDIATPAAYHYKMIKEALKANLHVLCEKPITTSLDDLHEVIELALSKKRVLFPCHNYKHAPVVKEIRKIVDSGEIGVVRSVTLNTFRNTHAVGVKDWKPNWRRHKEFSGGGIAMDHGSHSFYLTFDWLKSYPTSLTAYMDNFNSDKYDTEDLYNVTMQFPTGVATVHLTWTAGVRKVIYTVQGTKGAITVEDDKIEISKKIIDDRDDFSHKAKFDIKKYEISSDWMDSGHSNWFNSLLDQFLRAIKDNDFLNKELVDAFYSIQTIMKSYESANSNSKMVSIDQNYVR